MISLDSHSHCGQSGAGSASKAPQVGPGEQMGGVFSQVSKPMLGDAQDHPRVIVATTRSPLPGRSFSSC